MASKLVTVCNFNRVKIDEGRFPNCFQSWCSLLRLKNQTNHSKLNEHIETTGISYPYNSDFTFRTKELFWHPQSPSFSARLKKASSPSLCETTTHYFHWKFAYFLCDFFTFWVYIKCTVNSDKWSSVALGQQLWYRFWKNFSSSLHFYPNLF